MARSTRILAIDIGASKAVVAEFYADRSGGLELAGYGVASLGVQADSEADASAFVVSSVREIMREHGFKPAPTLMTISGQVVFPRYVKLPPVAPDKLLQMIRYEAEQNVPFPIEDVVWDYQLIGDTGTGEQNVVLVAVKIENVSSTTHCVQAVGLEPEIVDVAPMALYNAFRYNYPDAEGCSMILDIGARSSNVIFAEENRVFFRSIPVAGNAITAEIAKEFNLSFKEAEEIKLTHGFVAFGGVYAGPDNEVADRASKIIRNVVTRLHAEVNRSINFYRSQQGGNPPGRVLLSGGTAILPHLDTFFREKLNVEVEFLNPFINVTVNGGLDPERVSSQVHLLGEVTGVALRRSLTCPVELNLMPPDLVAQKVFRRRQPFFALSVVGLILAMLCWWGYFYRMRDVVGTRLQRMEAQIATLNDAAGQMEVRRQEKDAAVARVDRLLGVVSLRTQWVEMIEDIHGCLLDGMWLRTVRPVVDRDTGMLTKVEITGGGFEDLLRNYAEEGTRTAIEVFRDRLRASKYFTDETNITWQPPVETGAYAREFTIALVLETPMKVNGPKL